VLSRCEYIFTEIGYTIPYRDYGTRKRSGCQ
jgi:hypothetical protein